MEAEHLQPFLSPNIMIGNIICSFLSLFGCIFIICFFICVKQIRSLIHSLIFCIAISETINSIAHLFSINGYRNQDKEFGDTLCVIQTTLILLTDTSTMIFLCIICYCIVSLIIYNNKKLFMKKKIFYLLGTIIPAIFSGIILSLFYAFVNNKEYEEYDKYSIRQDLYLSWCWLKVKSTLKDSTKEGDPFCLKYDFPVIITLVVYWLMIIFIIYSIVKVILFIKKKQKISGGTALYIKIQNVISQLYNYPLVGCLCWLFTTLTILFPFYSKETTVRDIRGNYVFKDRISFLFLSMNGIFSSLKGFFIFIIFISGEKVYKIVSEKFDKMASNFKNNSALNVNPVDNSDSNNLEKTVLNEKLVFE